MNKQKKHFRQRRAVGTRAGVGVSNSSENTLVGPEWRWMERMVIMSQRKRP